MTQITDQNEIAILMQKIAIKDIPIAIDVGIVILSARLRSYDDNETYKILGDDIIHGEFYYKNVKQILVHENHTTYTLIIRY